MVPPMLSRRKCKKNMLKRVEIRDPALRDREKVIGEFAPAIRYMAERLAFRLPPSLDVEDLIHAGIIGLMDAIGKYDPSKEAKFKTYAEFRIRGSMLDEIRSLDWVPRSIRKKIGMLHRAYDALAKQLGRQPDSSEIAEAMELDEDQYESLLFETRAMAQISFEDLGLGGDNERNIMESLADVKAENPLLSLLSQDLKGRLLDSIKELPDKEKMVVSLYYDKELTMREIGAILSITESRVCQLHTQAMLRLKSKLRDIVVDSV